MAMPLKFIYEQLAADDNYELLFLSRRKMRNDCWNVNENSATENKIHLTSQTADKENIRWETSDGWASAHGHWNWKAVRKNL